MGLRGLAAVGAILVAPFAGAHALFADVQKLALGADDFCGNVERGGYWPSVYPVVAKS